MDYIIETHEVSVSRACRVTDLHRSVYYYESEKDDEQIIIKLNELAERKPTEGFWKLFGRIRNEGHVWNHKRVHRVYKMLGMNIKKRSRKRLPVRVRHPLEQPQSINEIWSMDFMSDCLHIGKRFRTLNIIDDYNREALAIEIGTSLPSERVIRTLEEIVSWRGKPMSLRVDNGPEFISYKLQDWCKEMGIDIKFIQPGKPTQNAYIERFNRSYRTGILDAYLFKDLYEVRMLTEEWMEDYNYHRPHEALNGMAPRKFAEANEMLKAANASAFPTFNTCSN